MNIISKFFRKIVLFLIILTPIITQAQIIKIGSDTAVVGENILIPLETAGLLNIGAMDIKIVFDSTKLQYIKDTLLSSDAMGILSNVTNLNSVNKQINLSWLSMGTTGVNIAPGNFMFFKFKYLGGNATLNFNLIDCEVVDWDGNSINVNFINGVIVPALGANYSVWNGNGFWSNSSNWSNGIPGAATNIVVNSGILELNAQANCNDVIIKNGATLAVLPDMSVSINGNIENYGNIIIKSDSTGTGSLINHGNYTGNGTVNFERYINKLNNNDFSLFTAPFNNVLVNSSTTGNSEVKKFHEPTQNWINLNPNDTIKRGIGYSIKPINEMTAIFSDTNLHSGSISFNNLTFSNSSSTSIPNGFNLIGNPYTSSIDWANSGIVRNNIDASIYCFDGVNYVSWNGQIGTFHNGIIPSLQGFFIKANSNNPFLQIPDSSRVHNNKSFMKKSQKNINNLLIIIAEGNSYNDIAYLNFNQNATQQFDSNYDAYKLFGIDEAPQVYTVLPSSNTKLSINVMDAINNNLHIPIGFKVGVGGSYSLKFDNQTSFPPNVDFYLFDSKTTNIVNLRNNPVYTFNANSNDNPDRFVLSFTDPTHINEIVNNSPLISIKDKKISISFDTYINKIKVRIFNILGQELNNICFEKAQNCTFEINKPKGCYIISINADDCIYNKKIIVED